MINLIYVRVCERIFDMMINESKEEDDIYSRFYKPGGLLCLE